MFTWDFSPIILSIGPLALRWYALTYILGFTLGYYILLRQKEEIGLTKSDVEEYISLLVMAGIIGGRIFYCLVYNPAYYFAHPLEIPAVWHGGMSIHGGLLGAIAATAYFTRKHKLSFFDIADRLVAPLALAMMLVRLANYVNGELWGTLTNASWCVNFPGVEGCRHPSQLYEALYSYVLFLVLFATQESRRLAKGGLFWLFVLLYGSFRFLVTFTRALDPTDPGILGISIGQWLSLAMVCIGAVMLAKVLKYPRHEKQ